MKLPLGAPLPGVNQSVTKPRTIPDKLSFNEFSL